MMMNYQQLLSTLLSHQQCALKSHQLDNEETVWIRKVNKGNPSILYSLQRLITVYLNEIPVLQPVYTNPHQSIKEEASRLVQLEKAGINVPHLMAQCSDGFMMSELPVTALSFNLAEKFDSIQKEGKSCLPLWKKSVEVLFALHAKGQYLSQAFLRNIMYIGSNNAEIGSSPPLAEPYLSSTLSDWAFFDLEEDPGQKLAIEECQTRDYFFFIHSSSHFIKQDQMEAVAFWLQQLATTQNQTIFLSTIRPIRKMRHLCFTRNWGRDFERFFSSIDFLLACEKHIAESR